ncbi:MAG: FHA domain-containing protein [Cyanobacteria bacterium J06641_5]
MYAIAIELFDPQKRLVLQRWKFDQTHSTISIGRSEENDIVLPSSLVSRQHVKLSLAGAHWQIRNFGKNGCYINDRKIQVAILHSGAFAVRLGKVGPYLRIVIGKPQDVSARSPQRKERQVTKKGIYVSEAVREFAARRSLTLTAEGTLEKVPDELPAKHV